MITMTHPRHRIASRIFMMRQILKHGLLTADTTTIRFLLAWASFVAGLGLLLDPDKFQLPAYSIIAEFGTERMWAVYFLLHWAGALWRIFEVTRSRPRCAVLINLFGFAIWFISTVGLAWAVGSVGIPTAMAATLCAASAWALLRTGMQPEVVSL